MFSPYPNRVWHVDLLPAPLFRRRSAAKRSHLPSAPMRRLRLLCRHRATLGRRAHRTELESLVPSYSTKRPSLLPYTSTWLRISKETPSYLQCRAPRRSPCDHAQLLPVPADLELVLGLLWLRVKHASLALRSLPCYSTQRRPPCFIRRPREQQVSTRLRRTSRRTHKTPAQSDPQFTNRNCSTQTIRRSRRPLARRSHRRRIWRYHHTLQHPARHPRPLAVRAKSREPRSIYRTLVRHFRTRQEPLAQLVGRTVHLCPFVAIRKRRHFNLAHRHLRDGNRDGQGRVCTRRSDTPGHHDLGVLARFAGQVLVSAELRGSGCVDAAICVSKWHRTR
jgi:hypothetical protein